MPKNLHLDGKNVERGPQLAAHMPFPPPPKSQDWLLDTRSRYQTLLVAKQKIAYTTGDARKIIARTTPNASILDSQEDLTGFGWENTDKM